MLAWPIGSTQLDAAPAPRSVVRALAFRDVVPRSMSSHRVCEPPASPTLGRAASSVKRSHVERMTKTSALRDERALSPQLVVESLVETSGDSAREVRVGKRASTERDPH